MKILKSVLLISVFMVVTANVFALEGKIAKTEDIARLKRDVLLGKIKVGQTRLKNVKDRYGEPVNITNNAKSIIYDYGDLKIEFSKIRYLRDWRYDSFKKPVYTDDVDKLRKDLESKEIDGDNTTYDIIVDDYEDPTESMPSEEDGKNSVYYYGDIQMTFENTFVVKSVKGKNLEVPSQVAAEGALQSEKKPSKNDKMMEKPDKKAEKKK